MFLHRRQDSEPTLHTPCVVIVDIAFNHVDQFLLAAKTSAVISLAFQYPSEPLHRSVVDTVCHPGHALRHACLFEPVVERPVRILESPVAVKQRMRIRVRFHCLVKSFEYERVVIPFTDDMSDDAPVVQIEDGTQVELLRTVPIPVFELRDIGQPFLVWFVRMELAVQQVFGKILRILGPSGAVVVAVFDGGLDAPGPADAKDALIINMDSVVMPQLIIDPAVALV